MKLKYEFHCKSEQGRNTMGKREIIKIRGIVQDSKCVVSPRDKREREYSHTNSHHSNRYPTINIISIPNKLGPHWMLSLASLAASHCLLLCHIIIPFFIHLTCINWTCLTHNICQKKNPTPLRHTNHIKLAD